MINEKEEQAATSEEQSHPHHEKAKANYALVIMIIQKLSCYGFWALLLVIFGTWAGIRYSDGQMTKWFDTTTKLNSFHYKGTTYEIRPRDIQSPPDTPATPATATNKKGAN